MTILDDLKSMRGRLIIYTAEEATREEKGALSTVITALDIAIKRLEK